MEKRIREVDEAMEKKFGKPDYTKAFIFNTNVVYIPLGDGKYKIWRVEVLGDNNDS